MISDMRSHAEVADVHGITWILMVFPLVTMEFPWSRENRGSPWKIFVYNGAAQLYYNSSSILHVLFIYYRVRQNKTPQHENRNVSKMREYFCTKFCYFVQHITAHKSDVSCHIYSTYALSLIHI